MKNENEKLDALLFFVVIFIVCISTIFGLAFGPIFGTYTFLSLVALVCVVFILIILSSL